MAKIRDIKNEVNYLTYEIISDCNTFMALHPEKKEAALSLIEETVALRNTLVRKINHPDQVNGSYFRAIKKELIDGADGILEKLRSLIQ